MSRGSALVELTWLGILLLVPVVYIMLAVFDVQRGAFAVTAAARAAARAYALSPDDASGQRAADAAAALALDDQGIEEPVTVEISCTAPAGGVDEVGRGTCRLPGGRDHCRDRDRGRSPGVPEALGGGRPTYALEAVHAVPYGQFRETR